jgi:hypothetical protein
MIYTSCLKNKNQDIKREERMTYSLSYTRTLLFAMFFRVNPVFSLILRVVRRKCSSGDRLQLQPGQDLAIRAYSPAGATQ